MYNTTHFLSLYEVVDNSMFVKELFNLRMFLLFLIMPLFDIRIYPCLYPALESWIWFISKTRLEDLRKTITSNPPCFTCQKDSSTNIISKQLPQAPRSKEPSEKLG
ncbi:hypothetical protein V8G54_006404 [Vigna mungo]|uniref:Uncharacterized protein n=1 Tax=Vigna mungo TaxID=3915 RepID=A0AAQ3S6D9_VIGMU